MPTNDITKFATLADSWPSLAPNEWLAAVPVIVRQLPPDQHLRFLVRLLTSLQRSGVDMSEHWDCLLEALILEKV